MMNSLYCLVVLSFFHGYATAETVCPLGTYGAPWNGESCSPCPTTGGVSCPTNSTSPIPCPKGSYCSPNSVDKNCKCTMVGLEPGEQSCGKLFRFAGDISSCDQYHNHTSLGKSCHLDTSTKTEAYSGLWLGGTEQGSCIGETCKMESYKYNMTYTVWDVQPEGFLNVMFSTTFITGILEVSTSIDLWLKYHQKIESIARQVSGSSSTIVKFEQAPGLQLGVPQQYAFQHLDPNLNTPGSIGLGAKDINVTFHRVTVERFNCELPCPIGTFNNYTGMSSPNSCLSCDNVVAVPGTFVDCTQEATGDPIRNCPKDCYCPGGVGSAALRHDCPVGTTTSEQVSQSNSTSCVQCVAGLDCSTTTRAHCPPGYYCTGSDQPPTPCPVGTFRALFGGQSLADCTICSSGYYGCNKLASLEEHPCGAGFWCDGNYTEPNPTSCSCNVLLEHCGKILHDVTDGEYSYTMKVTESSVRWSDKQYPLAVDKVGAFNLKSHLSTLGKDTNCMNSNYPTCRFTDVYVSTRVTMFQPDGLPFTYDRLCIGVAVMSFAPGPYIYSSFCMYPFARMAAFEEQDESVWSPIAVVPYTYEMGREYHVEVLRVGNRHSVYIDHVLVVQAWSSYIAGTKHGVNLYNIMMPFRVRDFYITGNALEVPCATLDSEPNLCPPGTYQNATASSTCIPCLAGYDGCESYGTLEPKKCDVGYSCSGGSAAREACLPGTYGDGTDCYPCPSGYVSSEPMASQCTQCDVGEYAWMSKECVKCPVGTFNDQVGATTCKLCGENTFGESEGSTSDLNCKPCGLGSYSAEGSGSCKNCAANMYNYTVSECTTENVRVIEYFANTEDCAVRFPPNPAIVSNLQCSFVPMFSKIGTLVASLAVTGGIICLALASWILLLAKRDHPWIKRTYSRHIAASFLGLSACCFSLLFWLGPNTIISCVLRDGLLQVSIALCISCLSSEFARHRALLETTEWVQKSKEVRVQVKNIASGIRKNDYQEDSHESSKSSHSEENFKHLIQIELEGTRKSKLRGGLSPVLIVLLQIVAFCTHMAVEFPSPTEEVISSYNLDARYCHPDFCMVLTEKTCGPQRLRWLSYCPLVLLVLQTMQHGIAIMRNESTFLWAGLFQFQVFGLCVNVTGTIIVLAMLLSMEGITRSVQVQLLAVVAIWWAVIGSVSYFIPAAVKVYTQKHEQIQADLEKQIKKLIAASRVKSNAIHPASEEF